MKKVISYILVILTIITSSIGIFATGDGNIESGGGGGSGSGTSQNKWRVDDDGVRITIVDKDTKQIVKTSIDFTNKSRADIKYHFGKVSKLEYKNGKKLSLYNGGYNYTIPTEKIPQIVNYNGKNDIEAIKKYFTSVPIIRLISEKTGIVYDDLISGQYKLLLEPMIYVTYKGNRLAMTSHEAAMYNEKMNNDIRMKFQSISHQALPFSMFLETSDLGFPAYTGATNKAVRDPIIKEQLGLGIVRFNGSLPSEPTDPTPPPPEPPPEKPDIDIDTKEYTYRTNTDVISSIEIKSNNRITPNNPISVTFDVLGKKHTVDNIVIPENSNQLVWIKWKTPSTPQVVDIKVSIENANISSANIKANVVELKEITPPDPTADDKNDRFKMPYLPNRPTVQSTSWHKWSSVWEEDLRWIVTGYDPVTNAEYGHWYDFGDWKYTKTTYSASLSASMNLIPDKHNPTSIKHKDESYEMKSGYGVDLKINTNVQNNSSNSDITNVQNVNTTFSEFDYKSYNRLLEKTSNDGLSSTFEFKKNKYSPYNSRTHFTPIWYKDKFKYIINAEILDVWTPTGMLSVDLNDQMTIKGNLWDDRHIAIMK
ncbi:MAG: hypothetical protein ACRCX2_29850 [Paraclostridium sp.]